MRLDCSFMAKAPIAKIAMRYHGSAIKMFGTALTLPICLLTTQAICAPASDIGCNEAQLKTVGELQAALNAKAVEIVSLASNANNEAQLKKLVDPDANFSLGAGDVGRPLGTGISGARALAQEMNADTYRFYVWSFIPTPTDNSCGTQEVKVEFIDTENRYSHLITFTFTAGRLVRAAGWTMWFESGPIPRASK